MSNAIYKGLKRHSVTSSSTDVQTDVTENSHQTRIPAHSDNISSPSGSPGWRWLSSSALHEARRARQEGKISTLSRSCTFVVGTLQNVLRIPMHADVWWPRAPNGKPNGNVLSQRFPVTIYLSKFISWQWQSRFDQTCEELSSIKDSTDLN